MANVLNAMEDVLGHQNPFESDSGGETREPRAGDKHVVAARTSLYDSVPVNSVRRIYNGPGIRVRGKAHQKAREHLRVWALEATTEVLKTELSDYAATTHAQETEIEVVSEESLKKMTFDAISNNVLQHAPCLFKLLSDLCTGPRQDRNKHKDPKFCIVIFINALAYQLSQYNNAMQKLLCIYFKAKDVPKSVYHLFQHCGIVMSYSWSVLALANISKAAMAGAVHIFENFVCITIYNNIQLAFAMKHQHGKNLTVTDNGPAITIIPMQNTEHSQALLCNPEMWATHWVHLVGLY
ncbi:hypothetical protein B0J17DRAFT_723280 [Rhizoctonia solani]|nr:hypothetical protein B0J17DRAFT_723280 [Rhizoctonia solani]